MTWNYRIVKMKPYEECEAFLAIVEVYYDEDGNPTAWIQEEKAIFTMAESVGDLQALLTKVKKALDKPVLEVIDNNLVEVEDCLSVRVRKRVKQTKEVRDRLRNNSYEFKSKSSGPGHRMLVMTERPMPPFGDEGAKTSTIPKTESEIEKSVFDVAAYILENMGQISTMKLQKLCYYAQAWNLVWEEEPLFEEDFDAWINGPVCPVLFDWHSGIYSVSECQKGEASNLSDTERENIDKVLSFYGDKSSQWLSDLIRQEIPWVNARKGLGPAERGNNTVTKDSMMMYYESL